MKPVVDDEGGMHEIAGGIAAMRSTQPPAGWVEVAVDSWEAFDGLYEDGRLVNGQAFCVDAEGVFWLVSDTEDGAWFLRQADEDDPPEVRQGGRVLMHADDLDDTDFPLKFVIRSGQLPAALSGDS